MFNATDILSLGTEYNVVDKKGNILKSIQVIPHTDILEAAFGIYNPQIGSYSDYLEKSISCFTGYQDLDPHSVLWYSTTDEELILSDLIEYAVKNGYDKIILEHLEDLE